MRGCRATAHRLDASPRPWQIPQPPASTDRAQNNRDPFANEISPILFAGMRKGNKQLAAASKQQWGWILSVS